MHTPRFEERGDSRILVIFVHGFMGSPNQFEALAELVLQNNCDVLSVLLPGHGGTMKQFVSCGLTDWENHLQNEIDKYKGSYSKIYLVGHSMGGLLALNASSFKHNKVHGVLMLSPPMKINILNPKSALSRFRLLVYPKKHEIRKCYSKANSITAGIFLQYLLCVKPVLQLKKLINKTKHNLANIFVPVVIIHSKHDETVSFKSAGILYGGLSNTCRKSVTLKRSLHVYYTSEEREIINNELVLMIKQGESNNE